MFYTDGMGSGNGTVVYHVAVFSVVAVLEILTTFFSGDATIDNLVVCGSAVSVLVDAS